MIKAIAITIIPGLIIWALFVWVLYQTIAGP